MLQREKEWRIRSGKQFSERCRHNTIRAGTSCVPERRERAKHTRTLHHRLGFGLILVVGGCSWRKQGCCCSSSLGFVCNKRRVSSAFCGWCVRSAVSSLFLPLSLSLSVSRQRLSNEPRRMKPFMCLSEVRNDLYFTSREETNGQKVLREKKPWFIWERAFNCLEILYAFVACFHPKFLSPPPPPLSLSSLVSSRDRQTAPSSSLVSLSALPSP